eukprot:1375564-Amphidinium_carterae.1
MNGPPGRGILSLEWITKLETDAFHERMNELGSDKVQNDCRSKLGFSSSAFWHERCCELTT